ncbi:hypothetical protein YC2023_049372 [Brassica napus]
MAASSVLLIDSGSMLERTSRSDNLRSTPAIFVVLPRKIEPVKRDEQTVNRCSGGRKKVVLSGFLVLAEDKSLKGGFSSMHAMMNLRWSFDVLSGLFIVVSGDDMIQKAKRKYKPLARASHAKGIVLELIGMEAKQPNSGICKCARVQLVENGRKVAAFVPNDDEVLISGFGRKSHAVGDIPGVRYKVVKVSGVLLSALYKDKKEKPRS